MFHDPPESEGLSRKEMGVEAGSDPGVVSDVVTLHLRDDVDGVISFREMGAVSTGGIANAGSRLN